MRARRYPTGQIVTLNASGVASVSWRLTEAWYVERICVLPFAGTVTIRVRVDGWLQDGLDAAPLGVADEYQPIFVPAGSELVVALTAGVAGSNVEVSLQVLETLGYP